MASQILVLALFLLTAAAVTARPWRVPQGWWPVAAVAIALLFGAVPLTTAAHGLGSCLDVMAFFAGLLLLAWSLRVIGLLDRLVDWMERWGGGDPTRFLLAVALATVAMTALLSNDAAALLLVPQVLDRLQRRGIALLPFVMTMAFIANAASALLPISNPANLLILDRSGIALTTYLTRVTPGAVLGVVITVAGCLLLLRTRVVGGTGGETLVQTSTARLDRWAHGLAVLMGVLVVVDVAFAVLRLPIGPPTLCAGAAAALLACWSTGRARLPQGLGWEILPLVAGFSVLASGLERSADLAATASRLLGAASGWIAAMGVGLVTAIISGVINNLPAALLVTAGLQAAHHLGSLALPAIVGADLGPNLAPFGSLSTILILAAARQRSEPVRWDHVLRLGLLLGPIALLPTLAVVALGH